jgi:hypothetical protein
MFNLQPGEILIRLLKFWYVCVAFAIVVFAAVFKIAAGAIPSSASVPSPPMPSPNARDFFVAAEALAKSDIDVGPMIDEPMATRSARGAFARVSLDVKQTEDKRNSATLAEIREGLRYPYMHPPSRSFDYVFSDLPDYRALTSRLVLDAQVRAGHGDNAGAMHDDLDGIQLGADLPNGLGTIGAVVANSCEWIARRDASTLVDRLPSGAARAAADRLRQIDAAEVQPWQTMQYEEWQTQGALLDLFRRRDWRAEMANIGSDNRIIVDGFDMGTERASFELESESSATAYNNYTNYMNALVAQEKLTWPDQLAATPPPMPNDYVNKTLLPVYTQAKFARYANFALNRLLETQLALHAYNLDHGRYPASLAELAPTYLASVPLDPFTKGAPLKYRVAGDSYVLYSVGPDTIDDGGKPIQDSMDHDDVFRATHNSDEKGDIVAGIND